MEIREATRDDQEAILYLVTKLAQYENKKPEDIELTLDKINAHGFGDPNYFNILLAEDQNKPIAYALYYFSYCASLGAPILYIEDLYVVDKYRRKGIGKAILAQLAQISNQHKCCRMEWHVYTWNEPALQFYKQLGAKPNLDLIPFQISGHCLEELTKQRKIE